MAEILDSILTKLQKPTDLSQDDLKALSSHFTPDAPEHAKAYLALSLFCQNARKGTPQNPKAASAAAESLVRALEPIITNDLTETDEASVIRGVAFLTAIFHVDSETAISILAKDGVLEGIMDTVDITPSPELALVVARLLAEATGHKKSRSVLSAATRQWLELQSRKVTSDGQLAVASGVARVKLWQGSLSDATEGEEADSPTTADVEELTNLMKRIVVSDQVNSGAVEAVEGLAYLSTEPKLKESLSKDSAFLKSLLGLIPDRKPAPTTSNPATQKISSPLLYGVLSIVSNLIAYRPRLTEEQSQIEQLKKMSKVSQSKPGKVESVLDDDKHVKSRVQRLVKAGVIPKLSIIPTLTDSQATLQNVARAFLSIVEDKEVRGTVLQAGGSKALQTIIKALLPKSTSEQSVLTLAVPMDALQALAKLSITSSPIQVYGADVGPIYDALRPLSLLILHSSATQLQQFEGMMALTNLASISPDFATRIADLDGLLSRVEMLLFEDHVLIRRASMELVCNLVSGSEKAFQKFAGTGSTSAGVKSKLQLVLAICDVEDVPTRLAASGTLAVLMNSTSACKMLYELQMEKGRFIPIMTELLSPVSANNGGEAQEDAGLIHRAIICVLNLFTQNEDTKLKELVGKYEADVKALQTTLMGLVKRREAIPLSEPILQVLLQTLKVLLALIK